MNKARLITHLSRRLTNSVTSTQYSTPNSFTSTQVTHFTLLHHPPSLIPLSRKNQPHQNHFFSTTPIPQHLTDLILTNKWSENIINELEKTNPKLTHECLVYLFTNLREDPLKILDFMKWVRVRFGFEPSSVLYSILLKGLVNGKLMEQFWCVVKEMKDKEMYISKETYLTVHHVLKKEKLSKECKDWSEFYDRMIRDNGRIRVAKDVGDVILGCDWGLEVENKLSKVSFSVSDEFLVMVMRVIWSQPLKALRFFNWVGEVRGLEHNAVTYNEMAKVLAQDESMGEFWSLVKKMRSEGFELDIDSYMKIWRRLCVRDAVELFEFMMDGPYKPSVQHCAIVLKELSNNLSPDLDLVHRVVKKFEEAGNTHTKSIYDGIHRCLCKVGRFDEAHKIVEDIRNAGYKLNNVTYSQEIHGLCKLERFEDALKVLESMEEEGCIPDLKTWTILIQGYCSAGEMDQALLCLGKMRDKNVNPDADLLKVFVDGFLGQQKELGAYVFLTEMVEKEHLKPWQATYKLMIVKLLEVGKLDEAFNLLSMMKQHGYPPYPDPFTQYISKSGTLEDAKKFLNALPVKGSPSTSAYVNVIKAFFNEGRHTEAKDLLYKSPRAVRVRKEIGSLFGSAKSSV